MVFRDVVPGTCRVGARARASQRHVAATGLHLALLSCNFRNNLNIPSSPTSRMYRRRCKVLPSRQQKTFRPCTPPGNSRAACA